MLPVRGGEAEREGGEDERRLLDGELARDRSLGGKRDRGHVAFQARKPTMMKSSMLTPISA